MVSIRRFWYHAESCKLGCFSRGQKKAQVQSRRANKEKAELLYSLTLGFTEDFTQTCLIHRLWRF